MVGFEPTTRKTHGLSTTPFVKELVGCSPGFFHEAVVQHVTYVTDFGRLCGRVVYPSWGTTPRNFQFSGTGVGRRSCDATCQITREGGAIIDNCIVVFVVFGSIALVALHARGSSL